MLMLPLSHKNWQHAAFTAGWARHKWVISLNPLASFKAKTSCKQQRTCSWQQVLVWKATSFSTSNVHNFTRRQRGTPWTPFDAEDLKHRAACTCPSTCNPDNGSVIACHIRLNVNKTPRISPKRLKRERSVLFHDRKLKRKIWTRHGDFLIMWVRSIQCTCRVSVHLLSTTSPL